MEYLKEYENPKIFWREVTPFLRDDEAKNSLMLGLAYSYLEHPENCFYQSAIFGSEKFQGALLCSKYHTNRNLILSPVASKEAATKLFESFLKKGMSINSIIGELKSAKIYQKLAEEKGMKTKVLMQQGVYRCRKVIMPTKGKKLVFRLASKGDTAVIAKWIGLFHKEAVPHDPPIDEKKIAAEKIKNRMIYVLEKDGKPVTCACWSRDTGTSSAINLVFTPKAFRKKGYASMAVAKLTQLILKQGKRETNLFTDITNPTSNKIYLKIGYKFVCDSIHLGVEKA